VIREPSPSADEDAIRAVVLDYVEGWFDGDAARMERALHPELVKRCRGIAGVTCLCRRYIDLVHLIRMPGGWQIVNTVWHLR
jgi:hypothetical protein